jgi:phosphoglycerate dehydrogenase-like enzyme
MALRAGRDPMAEPHDEHPGFAVAPPEDASWLGDAVVAGGGRISSIGEADGLIWGGGDVATLKTMIQQGSQLRWVQLPSAGVDRYRTAIDPRLTWTAAKGIYDEHVAEHVLGLAIAGFRHLGASARTNTWDRRDAATLFDSHVCILGGGGIAAALLRLLSPFRVHATVIRRHPVAMEGVEKTLPLSQLSEGLRDANLVVLALPLTAETGGVIAESQLRAMRRDAWLINVGRGKLVVTADLVRALREGWIGGAGLDVTDPEPLPVDHPLWQLENCIITPHVANPPNLERGPLSSLIRENVRRYLHGEPLRGIVDPDLGY